jgi:hypothetical protein
MNRDALAALSLSSFVGEGWGEEAFLAEVHGEEDLVISLPGNANPTKFVALEY